MRRVSKKKRKKDVGLKKLHDAYKYDNPICEYHNVLYAKHGIRASGRHPVELEHIWQQAGSKIEDKSNWISACRVCHEWKHGHSIEGHVAGIWCKVSKGEFDREVMRDLAGKDLIGWVEVKSQLLDPYFYDLAMDILERY